MWIRLEETWKNIFILKKSGDILRKKTENATASICVKTRNKRRDRAAVEKKEETKEKETEERVRKKECLMFVCLDAAV